MKQVPLPDGSTATVREASDLTRGERKMLRKKAKLAFALATELTVIGIDVNDPATWGKYAQLSDEGVAPFEQYQGELVLVGLVSWNRTYPDGHEKAGQPVPIPASQEEWDELRPVTIYDVLALACNDITTQEDFTVDGAVDPKAPSDDSTSSEKSEAVEVSSLESSLIPT